jgi:hypothetical protein
MGTVNEPTDHLAMVEKDNRIVALKREGLTFQQVADQLGISKSGAIKGFQRVKARVEERGEIDYMAYRDEQLARVATRRELAEDIMAARHVSISNGHVVSEITGQDEDGKPIYGDPYEDTGPTLAAIDRLIKLDEQEAKLVPGLYGKTEIDVSGDISYEIIHVRREQT